MEKKRSQVSWALIYTLLFCLMGVLIYWPVYKNGFALVKSTDGFDQHLKALVFYGRWLRTAAKSLIPGSGVSFPGFSFVLGFGADAATTLHYYAVGDPLNLLSAFVPEDKCVYLYQALIFVRMWLAGLSFGFFVRYKRRLRMSAVLAGSLVYAFCAFALFSSSRHPYFLNPLIYLPLVLLGTEKLFSEKKGGLLTLSVFISCVSNFYFFYMIALMTVLYVGWVFVFRYGLKDTKRLLRLAGAEAACSFTGVLLAGFLFVPVVALFLNNPRSTLIHPVPLLYQTDYYIRTVAASIGCFKMTHWGFLGVTMFGLLGTGVLITKKGTARFRTAVIGVFLMLMIPAAGYVMNGFSYVSNRWCWGAVLVLACCLVLAWEEMLDMGRRVCLIAFLLVGCFLLTISPIFKKVECLNVNGYRTTVLLQASVLIGVLLVILLLRRFLSDPGRVKRIAGLLLLCGIMVSLTANGVRNSRHAIGGAVKESSAFASIPSPKKVEKMSEKELKKLRESFWMTEGTVLSSLLPGEEDFFRYATRESKRNNSIPASLPSSQYYWSLIDRRVSDFLEEMALNTDSSYAFKDLNARSLLCRFLSVRYYLDMTDHMVPFGYSALDDVENPYGRVYQTYGCDQVLPFASAFDSCIKREDYEALPEIEREEALLKGVVLSEIPEGFEQTELVFSEKELPITISPVKKIKMLDGGIEVKKKGGRLKINLESEPGMETLLYFENLRMKIWNKDGSIPEGDVDADDPKARCIITIEARSGDQTLSRNHLKLGAVSNVWYSGRTNFLNCLGSQDQRIDSIVLSFSKPGCYEYDRIRVYSRDLSGADEMVRAASDLSQELDFHHDGTFSTSLITGKIGVEKEKMILLSLPYFDSWLLYLDGEKTPLLQADTMFCAFPVTAGEHEIRLVYRPRGAIAGALCSLSGLLICLGTLIRKRRQKA